MRLDIDYGGTRPVAWGALSQRDLKQFISDFETPGAPAGYTTVLSWMCIEGNPILRSFGETLCVRRAVASPPKAQVRASLTPIGNGGVNLICEVTLEALRVLEKGAESMASDSDDGPMEFRMPSALLGGMGVGGWSVGIKVERDDFHALCGTHGPVWTAAHTAALGERD